jgi:hypothetical protein
MTSLLRSFHTISLAGSAALLLMSIPSMAANHSPAAGNRAISGTCTSDTEKFKVSKDFISTTSTTFVNVTGSRIDFQQGGTSPNCVIVNFSSEAEEVAGETLVVQVLLDGSTLCQPDDNFFSFDDPDLADRAMNYICPAVAPGGHKVQPQFRSRNGGTVSLDFRTIIVHYTSP